MKEVGLALLDKSGKNKKPCKKVLEAAISNSLTYSLINKLI